MATSSPAANSSGGAKKLRAKTSRARWRAASGKCNRSRNAAALSPSYALKVSGKATSSSSIAAPTSTRLRSAKVNAGLLATKASRLSGGIRGIAAKESRCPPASTRG